MFKIPNQLQKKDSKYIWHPFTPQKNSPVAIPIIKAKDATLYGENGKTYIDAISSWWVTLHGHANPIIAESIYKQALELEQVIFAGFTHAPAINLAERLIALLPVKFSKVFYSDNGSTSTEVALKISIQYWWNKNDGQKHNRNKILAFKNSYHGDTFGAMSVSDRGVFTIPFQDRLFEVVFMDIPTHGNIHSLLHQITMIGSEIAAFIYEPLVQGAGGMCMYHAELLEQVLVKAKEYNILCIADEVMTGFGRTGKLFASNYLSVHPDIICLSKGITGGFMALGATICTNEVYEAFLTDEKTKTFFHGHSYTANPIACSAALASLSILSEKECTDKIKNIVTQHQGFAQIISQLNLPIKNIRTLGTIIAFEITQGSDGYLNGISTFITQKALSKGVYIRPLGNTLYLMPPYCITEEELTMVYATIVSILQNMTQS